MGRLCKGDGFESGYVCSIRVDSDQLASGKAKPATAFGSARGGVVEGPQPREQDGLSSLYALSGAGRVAMQCSCLPNTVLHTQASIETEHKCVQQGQGGLMARHPVFGNGSACMCSHPSSLLQPTSKTILLQNSHQVLWYKGTPAYTKGCCKTVRGAPKEWRPVRYCGGHGTPIQCFRIL